MILFKSKLYREEIKHWLLILILLIWGVVTSVLALRNNQKTLIIGIDDIGVRVITDLKDPLVNGELRKFLTYFISNYYSYNEVNFSEHAGIATELMSPTLWDKEKVKLLELKQKLESNSLSQTSEIENLDLIDQNRVEAILKLKIKSRLNEQVIRLKVNINIKKQEDRSASNPWNYQITELSDAVI